MKYKIKSRCYEKQEVQDLIKFHQSTNNNDEKTIM